MHTKFWLENLKERDHSEDLGKDGRIILQWILKKYGGKVRSECIGSGQGPMAGSCEQSNEPSGSIQGREFLD
jgi:hypothetical protein